MFHCVADDGGHRSKFASSSSAIRRTQSGGKKNSQSSSSLFTSGSNCQSLSAQTISALNIRSLLVGSSTSVRQTIKVDRLEDEILSGLPSKADYLRHIKQGSDPSSASVFDFDKVSEWVDMDVTADGKIVLTSTARSERVAPIQGADDMFKKKAVVVTKRIEIDMTLTPQRRLLFDLVKQTRNGGSHDDTGHRDHDGVLDKKAIFELYRKFVALAELDRAFAS